MRCKENLVPTLVENKTSVQLAVAKPTGLNELGVPLVASTAVKKGKSHEFAQLIEGGKIGRRFQNLRVTAIKTPEGEIEAAKLFVQFEAFGDDNVPLGPNSGFAATLYAGAEVLQEVSPGSLYLPYARFWYQNHFVFEISTTVFDRVDRIDFVAKADQVRTL
jgi:hypothetical protein